MDTFASVLGLVLLIVTAGLLIFGRRQEAKSRRAFTVGASVCAIAAVVCFTLGFWVL